MTSTTLNVATSTTPPHHRPYTSYSSHAPFIHKTVVASIKQEHHPSSDVLVTTDGRRLSGYGGGGSGTATATSGGQDVGCTTTSHVVPKIENVVSVTVVAKKGSGSKVGGGGVAGFGGGRGGGVGVGVGGAGGGVGGAGGGGIGREESKTTKTSRTDKGEVRSALDRYHQLVIHEMNLVQQLQSCDVSATDLVKTLGSELQAVLSNKMRELKVLVGDDNANEVCQPGVQPGTPSSSSSSSSPPTPPTPVSVERTVALNVDEQPTGNVVANKYLEPPLVVRVDDTLLPLAREGRLQVSASLCLTLSDEGISRTLDNKQDILQGHTVVAVSGEGYATFSKLKIMEVSSKHHHQAFSIQLQLQEIVNLSDGNSLVHPVGELAKLAPLHVQSRINKRKRSCFSGSSGSNNSNNNNSNNGTTTKPRKRSRGESDCNYVDITPLLVLPQKEAATRLGISESMLCKRFKECTRRKWPYRYLRKIDKMIRVLTMNKKSDTLPREDQEKIQRLKREREECLHPVKIRITGHDKSSVRNLVLNNISSSNNNRSNSNSNNYLTVSATEPSKNGKNCHSSVHGSDSESDPTDSNSSPYEEEEGDEEEEYEEDEISQVASTLNLLKNGSI